MRLVNIFILYRKAGMKLVPAILLLVVISFSTNARIRLYSPELAEKYLADSLCRMDSLRVVDSLRLADSLRVADSIAWTARYNVAGEALIREKIQNEKKMEAYKPVEIDSSERIIREEINNLSSRTIVIDENNQYARKIDSLQNRQDSICNRIHDDDHWFKNMKTFPISEKKRYMIFLMKNNYKDTSAILTCCNHLYKMYSCRLDLLTAIRSSQSNNARVVMGGHIDNLRQQLGELSNFIVALSPKIPFLPMQKKKNDLQ